MRQVNSEHVLTQLNQVREKAISRLSMVIRDRDTIETILLAKAYRIKCWLREDRSKGGSHNRRPPRSPQAWLGNNTQDFCATQYFDEASGKAEELTLERTRDSAGYWKSYRFYFQGRNFTNGSSPSWLGEVRMWSVHAREFGLSILLLSEVWSIRVLLSLVGI